MFSDIPFTLGLIASVIAIMTFIYQVYTHIPFSIIPRIKCLNGEWQGTLEQRKNKSTYMPSVPITLMLKTTRKNISGTAEYIVDQTKTAREISINGQFYDNKYLYLEYKNNNNATTQHGRILLTLSGDALTASGEYIGVSIGDNGIVSGHIKLKKQHAETITS